MSNWADPAAWYDAQNPWGPSDDFYLRLAHASDRVLDVGCGTGMLLKRARVEGHTGRLVGIDPDPAMLAQATASSEIEWKQLDAASIGERNNFDLAIMASHAFQFLVTDDEIADSLNAIHAALVVGGRFAFETRNPQAREWQQWHGASFTVTNPAGEPAHVSYEVSDAGNGIVTLTETMTGKWWAEPTVAVASMRFLELEDLNSALTAAGFVIDDQSGDWDIGPIDETSAEFVTIARKML